MKTLIYNGQIIIDGIQKISNGYLLFDENGIIAYGDNYQDLLMCEGYQKIDAEGQWVTPGLIDIHNHGALGYDFVSCSNAEINLIGKSMINDGVTSFLASTTVDSKENMAEMAKRLGGYSYQDGAECIGIHMEGPYMSKRYHAMMLPEFLRDADIDEYKNWQQLSNNFVKTITLAPERNGSMDFIKAVNKEVAVMLGHTDAKVSEIQVAAQAGARGFTHFYNAMSQHQHRQPGVVTAGFLCEDLFCELICDGMHVAKEVVQMTIRYLTPKRIILVTDAMPGKGMGDGKFYFCSSWVIKENGKTHLEGDDRIAGSIIPLNEMCRNILQWCNCTINDVVQMACVNPAKIIAYNNKGSLAVGKAGDIVIFDQFMNPQVVFVAGERKK